MSALFEMELPDATLYGAVFVALITRESGNVLLTRIAGLLLSAIAVQLVADSVRGFRAER